jgi:hypothetical protein
MHTTRLEFHHLTFVEDRDGVTVGRSDVDSYAVLPADGAALLRRLVDGMAVDDAAQWYGDTFGETVDMEDFVEALHELQFVRAAGEKPAAVKPVPYQRLGRVVFSPIGWLCIAAIIGAAVVTLVLHPELRPGPRNVFFVSSLVIVQITLTLVQPLTIMVHESFHVLAGRRLGLPTRLGIGRRLYFVVFETELNGLLGVEKRKRYLPFLAGMVADVLVFSTLTLFALLDTGWPGRLALALAYTTLLRLVWQFLVFLRTDLYYVIVTKLGCTDLHAATSDYLRRRFGWLPRVGPAATDESAWSERDRQMAPGFAVLTVCGVGVLFAVVALGVIPVVVNFLTRLVSALQHGFNGGAPFWDSVIFLLIVILELVVLPLVAGRRQNRNATS